MPLQASMGATSAVLYRPLVLALCTVCLSGCPGPSVFRKPTTGTTKGTILVDSPEVYHRERLIQDRERQKTWLHQQLDVDDAAFEVFEALISQQSLRSMSTSLGIDATPQAGLTIREADAAVDTLAREQAIADLEHQIRVAQLTEQLKRAQEGESVELPGPAGGATNETGVTSSSEEEGPDARSGAELPSTSIAALTARSSPSSRFHDRLAFRELVRQEILENDLDDSHDLTGNTLYRWSFDATIFPESDTSQWAVVQVDVLKTHPCDGILSNRSSADQHDQAPTPDAGVEVRRKQLRELLVRWKDSLYETLESEIWRVEQFVDSESDLWPRDLQVFRSNVAPRVAASEEERLAQDPPKVAAAKAVALSYEQQLPPSIRDLLVVEPDDLGKVEVKVKTDDGDEVRAFCEILMSLETRVEPYAVTPKETVQRIADLSAAQAASDRALGLALAAGTVGLTGALEASRQELFQRDSILRQPLVVGFSLPFNEAKKDPARIGWILGPRFKPRESGFDFRHTPIQLALSAVVSLPAWWPSAEIEVRTCWVSDSADGTQPDTPPCASTTSSIQHSVRLPGKPDELTRAVFPVTRGPKPFLTATPSLEIERADTIVILGQNLWRNPVVLVGNERADRVEILPDMRGVSATFSKVRQPAGWSLGQQFSLEPISIWTSEGTAVAGSARIVRKVEPPVASADKALFTVATATGLTWVASKDRTGLVRLDVKPEKDFPKNEKVYLTIEKAEFDSAATPTKCLNITPLIWEVTPPCSFDVAMRNLVIGEVVTLRTHRKLDAKRKVEQSPISLEVR